MNIGFLSSIGVSWNSFWSPFSSSPFFYSSFPSDFFPGDAADEIGAAIGGGALASKWDLAASPGAYVALTGLAPVLPIADCWAMGGRVEASVFLSPSVRGGILSGAAGRISLNAILLRSKLTVSLAHLLQIQHSLDSIHSPEPAISSCPKILEKIISPLALAVGSSLLYSLLSFWLILTSSKKLKSRAKACF